MTVKIYTIKEFLGKSKDQILENHLYLLPIIVTIYSDTILYTVKCGSPGRLEEEGMVEEEGGRVEVEMVEEEGRILDTDLVSPVTQADIPDSGITEISEFGPIEPF